MMLIRTLHRMAAIAGGLLTLLCAGQPAVAASPVMGAYVDNATESPDGGSLANTTTVSLIGVTSLAGWKLTADVAYKAVRGGMPSLAEQRRSGRIVAGSKRKAIYETYGLTDTRISAERSIRLVGKVKLDLLARATMPTGQRGTVRARGRYEAMLDAGLRTKVGRADIWAGAARRFRTAGFDIPGRDINEVYAGASVPVGKRTVLRADYLRSQSPFIGSPVEKSISGGATHTLDSGIAIDFYGSHFNDAYGKGVQVGLSLRMPTASI